MRVERFLDLLLCVFAVAVVGVSFFVPVCRDSDRTTAVEPAAMASFEEVDREVPEVPSMDEEDVLAYLNKNANPGGQWKMDEEGSIVFYPSDSFAEGLSMVYEYPDAAELLSQYGDVLDAFCEISNTIDKVTGKEYHLVLASPLQGKDAMAEIAHGEVIYDAFGTR